MSAATALRAAIAADVDAMHAIEVASFSQPWRREAFRDLVLGGSARVVVAVESGAVVGYGVLVVGGDEAELANLAVQAVARRRGAGRLLVDRLVADAARDGVRRVFLEVRESNVAALALYRSLGFDAVGRRRAYYRLPDEDAILMRKEMTGTGATTAAR